MAPSKQTPAPAAAASCSPDSCGRGSVSLRGWGHTAYRTQGGLHAFGDRVDEWTRAGRRGTRRRRRLLPCGELSVGRADLPAGQPAAEEAAGARAHQAPAPGSLGHHAGPEHDLRALQPGDPRARPRHDLHHRPRSRGTGDCLEQLARGQLQRRLPDGPARREGPAPAVPAVLLPRRDPQPCRPGAPGLDPRGWRARLLAGARLRSGLRQPGARGHVRRRRRRGGDRGAGRRLGSQRDSSTRHATGRYCRSCTSMATRSRTPRCSPGSGTTRWRSCWRVRLEAVPRRGRRPDARAPGHGRDPGHGAGRDPRHPGAGPGR